MWNLEKILGCIGGFASVTVGWYKFGWAGLFLVFAMFVSCCLYFSGVQAEYDEEDEPEHDSCDSCKHNLGGGHCKVNLEGECREGGGYEAWED